MNIKLILIIFFILPQISFAQNKEDLSQPRKWIVNGKHILTGQFIRIEKGQVLIKVNDDKITKIPLNKLDLKDQCLIKEDLSQPREWSTGNSIFTGQFIRIEKDQVLIKDKDGKIKKIPLHKLDLTDQLLIKRKAYNPERTKAISLFNPDKKLHPVLKILEDAKTLRLNDPEGAAYYQAMVDSIYRQIPVFEYPKDFLKNGNRHNPKYEQLKKVKNIPISKRKNLFTGKPLATFMHKNEPECQKMNQEIVFAQNETDVYIAQKDTFYAGGLKKEIEYGVLFPLSDAKKAPICKYTEKGLSYTLHISSHLVENEEGNPCGMKDVMEQGIQLTTYDGTKRIAYELVIFIDSQGKIISKGLDEGAIQMYSSGGKDLKHRRTYPDDSPHYRETEIYPHIRAVLLNRYDADGSPLVLNKRWNNERGTHPVVHLFDKIDNPFNVFDQRNKP